MDLDLEGRDEVAAADAGYNGLGLPQWISTWRVETSRPPAPQR